MVSLLCFSANENTAKDIKTFLKALYGSVKEAETADGLSSGETLPELIVDNFDEEQIWQVLFQSFRFGKKMK